MFAMYNAVSCWIFKNGEEVAMKYSRVSGIEFLNFMDVMGAKWKVLFSKIEFQTNATWYLFINMWRYDGPIPLVKACSFINDFMSPAKQRDFIYRSWQEGYLISKDPNVYLGSDRAKRKEDKSYGAGKASPLIQLSPEMRKALDRFFEDVLSELESSNASIFAEEPALERAQVRRRA